MKQLFTCLTLCIMIASANAQDQTFDYKVRKANDVTVSTGIALNFPGGDFGETAGNAFGVTGILSYVYTPSLNLTLTAGFMAFSGQDVLTSAYGTVQYTHNAVPVLIGARYFVNNNSSIQPFIGIKTGVHIIKTNLEFSNSFFLSTLDEGQSKTKFSFGAEAGANFSKLDAAAVFMHFSGGSYAGIRVGYILPLNDLVK